MYFALGMRILLILFFPLYPLVVSIEHVQSIPIDIVSYSTICNIHGETKKKMTYIHIKRLRYPWSKNKDNDLVLLVININYARGQQKNE